MHTQSSTRVLIIAGVVLVASALEARAVSIHLGDATGGVAVYYNNNGNGENPANQSHFKAQFSLANTNGAEYNFDSTPIPGTGGASWFSIFQAVPDQFGLDTVLRAPTNDNTVPVPVLNAYDNVDGSIANRTNAGPVTWSIGGYTGSTDGPADPGNQIINSLFRGGTGNNDNVTFTISPVQQMGTLFTVSVSGQLITDGLIHWYNPASGSSPVGNFELTGKFFYSGTLTYDSSTDTSTNLVDFYAGSISVEAEVICGTRYVSPSGNDFPGGIFNNCRNSGSRCKTIQRTVDIACPGDTINLAAGNYPEQVKITKDNITVNGPGATVKPSSVVTDNTQGSPCSNGLGTAIILVSGVTGVTLNGLAVDGSLINPMPARFVGIYYRNASGAISGGSVSNIKNSPLDGVQNGLGIYVQAKGSNVATVNTTGVTVSGYQKNGITYNGCGCADTPDGVAKGTVSGNTLNGAGAVPVIAQNGVQVGFGAGPVTISNNAISGHRYTGDPSNGTGSGVLIFSSKNNIVAGNQVTANNDGIVFEGGSFGLCIAGDSTGNSATCNRIEDHDAFAYESGVKSDAAANTVNTNAITGNSTGVDGSAISSGTLDAQNNWWGCVAGPGNAGCDTVSGPVDFTPVAISVPACVLCTNNADCNDGIACNGSETCNAGTCQGGMPVNCSGLSNQCNVGTCIEPTGTCVAVMQPNGTVCTADNDTCSIPDTCQTGICTDGGGGDPDGDNLCNADDNCDGAPNPGQEDLDNDGLGNACDSQETGLNVTRVRVKRDNNPKPTVNNGMIVVQGDFLVNQLPGDAFNTALGVFVRVVDSLTLDQSSNPAWSSAQCLPPTANGTVRCKTTDRSRTALFKPVRTAPNTIRFTINMRKLAINGPFQEPITVTLTHGVSIDRVGTINDCSSSNSGILCREL